MNCIKCGTQINDGGKFCGNCGTKNDEAIKEDVNQDQNKGVAVKDLYSGDEKKRADRIGFNPRMKDFLEKYENVTVLGIFWAGWWRYVVIVYGTVFLISIFIAGLGTMLE